MPHLLTKAAAASAALVLSAAASGAQAATWLQHHPAQGDAPAATSLTLPPGQGYVASSVGAASARAIVSHAAALGEAAAGVPEPIGWALMIVGFGGVGAVLRGKRRQASTPA